MKYLVINTEEPDYNRSFIVEADSNKEAVDKVYEVYGEEYRKKDYKAFSIDKLEYEDGVYCIE